MLPVEHFEFIRRMVLVDGLSEREVARRLGHSRKSICKAIEHSSPVPYKLSEPKPRPKLDPFLPIIRQWLIDDREKPRKQRHTATKVWERLRDEYQFAGKLRNVSDFVSKIRRELAPPEVFVPIEHPPGEEFQIDWGEATIELNNAPTKVMIFCARSAHSKATFVRAYMRDDLPSFLDAHVWLMSQLGGIPKRLAYDNLSSAVTSIGPKGQRTLTSKFTELRSHYLFETRFCNVARGNEKGHVENSVKRAERTDLTPVPHVTSLELLNQHLHRCCADDLSRICSRMQRTYGELLAEERTTFRELPRGPFMAASSRSQKVDRQSTIKFANARYSVPLQYACLPVVVQSFVDRVEILRREQIIASHARIEPGKWALKLEHDLPVLERKPGLLDSGLPFTSGAGTTRNDCCVVNSNTASVKKELGGSRPSCCLSNSIPGVWSAKPPNEPSSTEPSTSRRFDSNSNRSSTVRFHARSASWSTPALIRRCCSTTPPEFAICRSTMRCSSRPPQKASRAWPHDA